MRGHRGARVDWEDERGHEVDVGARGDGLSRDKRWVIRHM